MKQLKLFYISMTPAILLMGWFVFYGGWFASFITIYYGLIGLIFAYLWHKKLEQEEKQ